MKLIDEKLNEIEEAVISQLDLIFQWCGFHETTCLKCLKCLKSLQSDQQTLTVSPSHPGNSWTRIVTIRKYWNFRLKIYLKI